MTALAALPRFGLGAGGFSRLGTGPDAEQADWAAALLHAACDAGVRFIDTAPTYGTESLIGAVLAERREPIMVASKIAPRDPTGRLLPGSQVRPCLEASLQRLRRDRIDLYQIHGLRAEEYDHARQVLLPALIACQEEGLIASIGLTEAFEDDPGHRMLRRAVDDAQWDSFMVGYNWLNRSAAAILAADARSDRRVLGMFLVRGPLGSPAALAGHLAALSRDGIAGLPPPTAAEALEALLRSGESLATLSYRYALRETRIHCLLCGTGRIAHLNDNLAAFAAGPLDDERAAALEALVGERADLTGQPR